jgi:hypothetical protein
VCVCWSQGRAGDDQGQLMSKLLGRGVCLHSLQHWLALAGSGIHNSPGLACGPLI